MQTTTSARVAALRQWLRTHNYSAIIIPHEDEFLSEYLPEHNDRLHWLTGFTGSAGLCVITTNKAAIFVDGRYTVQVTKQVPADIFEYQHLIEQPFTDWLVANLAQHSQIAIDPKLHSTSQYRHICDKLAGYQLRSIDNNPIDELWVDRPAPLLSNAYLMDVALTGKSSQNKRRELGNNLRQQGVDAAIISQLDSICWLLNIRGHDVPHLPVLLTCAILYQSGEVQFFIDSARLPGNFIEHVGMDVFVYAPCELEQQLNALEGKQVAVDTNATNAWITQTLSNNGANIIDSEDPCLYAKAVKNSTEIAGMQDCHIKDGVAVSRFLAWLDNQVANGQLHDEATLSNKLSAFRQQESSLVDLSFATISAAASNAAMCHYNHLDQAAPATLELNNVYLVDSGGQYLNGTTDITRTIAVGECSAEIKQAFTLVLKGHIALACARFPTGTCGHQLDTLARQHLWAHGLDYDHGTGHGVGHCLSVHEGPQRISKVASKVALQPGMVLSNEPGYYKGDAYGIRIENLELVVEVATEGERATLGFAALTRAPIDKRLVDTSLLTQQELDWWNAYHQRVWQDVSPFLQGEDLAWLQQATAELTLTQLA